MKTFDLPAAVRLKILKVTPHKEFHGEDRVQAISLRLSWETTNEHLALLHPQLKDMLFWRPPQLDAQQTAEGIPETTPCLRVPTVALPLKLEASFSGYTFTIDHGIDDSSALELYVCELSKFAVDAKEGGSAIIAWSVGSNKEITPELVGELCALEGGEIVATQTPPAVAAGPVIDGTTDAFRADHPEADLFGEPDPVQQDAAAMFAEQHGQDGEGGPGAGDSDDAGGDSEGGETDITQGAGEAWPDAAVNEAAELEMGMAASMAAAGLAPKAARRTRRAAAGAVE